MRFTVILKIFIIFLFSMTTACGEEQIDGDADGDADGDSDSDADGDSDGDADGDSDSDADGDSDGDADGDSDGDADGDSDSDADGDSDGDSDILGTATSLSQFGITWTFDASYPYGQFVNGDFWVIGPIVVTDITQSSDMDERDGSMLNPIPGTQHGYDGRVGGYNPLLDVSGQLPMLDIHPDASLVSTISRVPEETDRALRRPALEVAAVLTVLATAAPSGSFRPPYAGEEKPLYSSDSLRTDLLTELTPVASTPSMTDMESLFEKPWIDHVLEWQGDDLHPEQNMNNYGAGISLEAGHGALRLLLDDSITEKELLLIRYVQLGIDNFGLVESGANWGNPGGTIGVGRKLPILIAGLMLDDADLQNVAIDYETRHLFQEDGQTFYLTQAERDATYNPVNCSGSDDYCHPGYYDELDLGTPCWGERHYRWLSTDYGYLPGKLGYLALTHESTTGTAVVVRVLGIEALWNHEPFLDWTDRCKAEGVEGTWGSQFSDDMWDAYR